MSVSGNGTNTLTFSPALPVRRIIQATLRTVTYDNTTGDEGAGPKTVNFTAVDPHGATAAASSQIVINTTVSPSTVVDRFVFYKGSARYDQPGGTNGRPASIPFSDDNAIATDKSAYLPNGTSNAIATRASMANLTSYDQGINGIMVDLMGRPVELTRRFNRTSTPVPRGSPMISLSAWATTTRPPVGPPTPSCPTPSSCGPA